MLTTLSTLKSRLAILDTDTQYDALLTNALNALGARFDKECRRTLARTVNATQEFDADDTEIRVACYPIESITRFELKRNEAEGWVEQTNADFLLRRNCVISLASPLGSADELARVTYTGGYLLPGTPPPDPPVPACQALPADLENAAVEQVAFWFQNRDLLGIKTVWEYHGTYQQFVAFDLLLSVQSVLNRYTRFTL